MKNVLLVFLTFAALPGVSQPPAAAPNDACDFTSAPANTPIRILEGTSPVPYVFACRAKEVQNTCIAGKLTPGLVVSIGRQENGWTCVTGGDSTAGWVPSASLAEVPAEPPLSSSAWIGWWRLGKDAPGIKNDRLLITAGSTPGSLHISGRAYWYGINDVIHFGQVNADAKPIGSYLHAVEGDSLSGCVIDLRYDPATHLIHANDNMQCGGMNVRFAGTWSKFTPSTTRNHKTQVAATTTKPYQQSRVPHLRDGFIVAKVGNRAKARSAFPPLHAFISIQNPQQNRMSSPQPNSKSQNPNNHAPFINIASWHISST